ncbi:Carbon monoxide dehydrogenase subunit G (CoxG) [Arthrobacter sp. ok909]|uniref:SRPBCC family protein n=1 Tax=Arthrobacter sp. ok909 TaxID=1761746 RepID=UPI00087F40AD|nr:SRPBCC family protein [Arthrobacter sp. ok909]SDO90035.1 Carbon monoxide dehydrogenase subunit G (CoxG) [Arthrobacter sp. ok909]
MQIDSTFSVVAPIDTVWDTLMDFERVAGCLPGARILNKLSDDAYQVGMSVKLGPVSMQYKGLLNVIERNAAEHRAVLGGKAQETRGQGTAEATVTLSLTEEGDATRGSVSADLALSGKAAAMGKGVIGSVTEQMMALFANNLQAMLAEGAPPVLEQGPEASSAAAPSPAAQAVPEPVPASAAVSAPDAGTTAATPTTAAPTATAPAMAGAPAGAAPAGSLDALSLAKGIAADQLSNPATVLGVVAVVACIAYWAGRRSAFRMLRLCGRL